MGDANEQVVKMCHEQYYKWTHRANVKRIQEGGSNTKYFHFIANEKHKRKKIFQLEQDEATIIRQEILRTISQNSTRGCLGHWAKTIYIF
jgi:hypothetical protein